MENLLDMKICRFIIVGVVNTFIGMLIMFCLYNVFGCSYWVSTAANYILVSILSYVLNKRFTFGHKGGYAASALRFAVNIAVCYLLAYGIAKPSVGLIMNDSSLYIKENVAMLTGMCIFTALNYLGQKYFVFGKTEMEYEVNYRKWLNSSFLSDDELDDIKNMSEEECYDAFYKKIEFGTAGMRGKIGIGTNRLNRYTVRLAAYGMARTLGPGKKVVLAYDTRHESGDLAREAARVFAAYGINAIIFDRYSPVPLLSFAVRHLGCDGGVVVTASHNTNKYNGFKTYNSLGAQMTPEVTSRIYRYMNDVKDIGDVKMASHDDERISFTGQSTVKAFIENTVGASLLDDGEAKAGLDVLYTPLFGSGRDYVKNVLLDDGFENLMLVEEQSSFDGDFPGLEKANPEDPAVFEKARKIGKENDSDLILATDPDSDRLGIAVRDGDTYRCLTGNQVGALLTDYMCTMRDPEGMTLVTTIVSGDLAPAIAEKRGASVTRTLTGSKYVCDQIDRMSPENFLLGFEESYGYVATASVRDKDAVSAAMFISEMAAMLKKQGKTLIDRLGELYEEYGYYIDAQDSFVFEGAEGSATIKRIMNDVRDSLYENRRKEVAEFTDYIRPVDGLPASDVLKVMNGNGSWLAARPSGTEPKIKFYYCIRGNDEREASETYERAAREVGDYLKQYV